MLRCGGGRAVECQPGRRSEARILGREAGRGLA